MTEIQRCYFYLHFLKLFLKNPQLARLQLIEIKNSLIDLSVKNDPGIEQLSLSLDKKTLCSTFINCIINNNDVCLDKIYPSLTQYNKKLIQEVIIIFLDLCDKILNINFIMESMFSDDNNNLNELQLQTLRIELKDQNISPQYLLEEENFWQQVEAIVANNNNIAVLTLRELALRQAQSYLKNNAIKKDAFPQEFPDNFPEEVLHELYPAETEVAVAEQNSPDFLWANASLGDSSSIVPLGSTDTISSLDKNFYHENNKSMRFKNFDFPRLDTSPEYHKRKRETEDESEQSSEAYLFNKAMQYFSNKLKDELTRFNLIIKIDAINREDDIVSIILDILSPEITQLEEVAEQLTNESMSDSSILTLCCSVNNIQNKTIFEIQVRDVLTAELLCKNLNEIIQAQQKPAKVRRRLFSEELKADVDNFFNPPSSPTFFQSHDTASAKNNFSNEVTQKLKEILSACGIERIEKENDSIRIKIIRWPDEIIKNFQLFTDTLTELLETEVKQENIFSFIDEIGKHILITVENKKTVDLLLDLLTYIFSKERPDYKVYTL